MPPARSLLFLLAGEEGLAFGQFGLVGTLGLFFQMDSVVCKGEFKLHPCPAPEAFNREFLCCISCFLGASRWTLSVGLPLPD